MLSDDGSNPEPDPDYTEYMTGKKTVIGNEAMPGYCLFIILHGNYLMKSGFKTTSTCCFACDMV